MGKREKEPGNRRSELVDDLGLEPSTAPANEALRDPDPVAEPELLEAETHATPRTPSRERPVRRYESQALPERVRVPPAKAAESDEVDGPEALATVPELRRPEVLEPTEQGEGESESEEGDPTLPPEWSPGAPTAKLIASIHEVPADPELQVGRMLEALNFGGKAVSPADAVGLARALGAGTVPVLMRRFESLDHAAHRRAIGELIAAEGALDPTRIGDLLAGAQGELLADVLQLAAQLRPAECVPLIVMALHHESPKARTWAISHLRRYPKGGADDLLARRLLDVDPDVRQAAVRLAVIRRSAPAVAVFERIFDEEDVSDRDPRELKMLMAAYAAIAGPRGVALLSKILNPGLLSLKKAPDAQVAAALALGRIGNEEAREALKKGLRTINRRVRDACHRALLRERDRGAIAEVPKKSESTPMMAPEPESERDREEEEELLTQIGQVLEPPPINVNRSAAFPLDEPDPFMSIGRLALAQALNMPVGLGSGGPGPHGARTAMIANAVTQALPPSPSQSRPLPPASAPVRSGPGRPAPSNSMVAFAQEKTRLQPTPPSQEGPLSKRGFRVLRPSESPPTEATELGESVAPAPARVTPPESPTAPAPVPPSPNASPPRLPSAFLQPAPKPVAKERMDTEVQPRPLTAEDAGED